MTRFYLSLIAIVALVLSAQSAQALPITSKNWTQMPTFMMESTTFPVNGVVAMSNCSASLVKFKGASDDSEAVVLTNGHCTGGKSLGSMFLQPGEIHNKTPRTFRMTLLDKKATKVISILSTEIIYATMTLTDFALLKLDKTYAQLRELVPGLEPLVVSDVRPSAGMAISIPSGYWKRTYVCSIDAFVPVLKEAGYVWKDAIRYMQPGCETIGGTSGSPIVSVVTGEVIGINNTGNEDGQVCTMNNPCEQDEEGNVTAVTHGASYGQQTYIFYACLDKNASFDLNTPGCTLPKGQ